jgi:hypothetical protein
MHVHPPKAVHGWREFAKEIVIIVIGVLIAVGFEDVAEEIHWRHKADGGHERGAAHPGPARPLAGAPCVAGRAAAHAA